MKMREMLPGEILVFVVAAAAPWLFRSIFDVGFRCWRAASQEDDNVHAAHSSVGVAAEMIHSLVACYCQQCFAQF